MTEERFQLVIELYRSGLTTRKVAEMVGLSPSYVAKLCRIAGIARTTSEVTRNRPRKATTHWRSLRNRARKLVATHLGRKLESTEHVHHKDGNYLNNSLDNLEILDPRTHAHRHQPPNPVPRHLRPARRAYMAQYWRARHPPRERRPQVIPSVCVVCGREYLRNKHWGGMTCSHTCGSTLMWQRRRATQVPEADGQ